MATRQLALRMKRLLFLIILIPAGTPRAQTRTTVPSTIKGPAHNVLMAPVHAFAGLIWNHATKGDGILAGSTPTVNCIHNICFADQFSSIQAAIDNCPTSPVAGCRVIVPGGKYGPYTAAIHPRAGVELDCVSPSVYGTAETGPGPSGTILTFIGPIWGFENEHPTNLQVNNFRMNNCTFDQSGNPSALGGLNLRSMNHGSYHDIHVLLPATGSMDGVRLEDVDATYGVFWNDFYGLTVTTAALSSRNTHIGVHLLNSANSNHFFGGMVNHVGTSYKIENGVNNVLVVGGGADDYSAGCINIDSGTDNVFEGVRCETDTATNPKAVAITIGATAYDNTVKDTTIIAMDAAHSLIDNSNGRNTLEVRSSSSGGAAWVVGNNAHNMQFGFNKLSTLGTAGLDISGQVRNDHYIRNIKQNDFRLYVRNSFALDTPALITGSPQPDDLMLRQIGGNVGIATSGGIKKFWIDSGFNANFVGQIKSTVPTGTAPLTVASQTNVANLNVSSLNGATFSAPGPIGSITPSTGAFTKVTLGSGSTASKFVQALAAIAPAPIAANTCAEQTFNPPEFSVFITTDIPYVSSNVAFKTMAFPVNFRISTNGTLGITYCNPTAGTLIPTPSTITVTTWR